MPQPIEELRRERLKKLEKIRELGFDPYPSKFDRKHTVSQARKKKMGSSVTVGGRVMAWREHGKIAFADLMDETGKMQLAFKADSVSKESKKILEFIDVGDFVGVSGTMFMTKAGEPTVEVSDLTLLSKSLIPLPAKSGLSDVEERYRKRYLDLILNPEVRERFDTIFKIIESMRQFLLREGYSEVLTPVLQPLYGGTLAQPFVTHFNALDSDFYLRIANELYLKRLIVGGYEKVFEFSLDFRNEGIDTVHNPEFLQMETMWAYANYEDNMEFAERLISHVAHDVLDTAKITYQGKKIDLKPPWGRVRLVEAVEKETGADWAKVKTLKDAQKVAEKLKIDVSRKHLAGEIIEEIFDTLVKPKLVQPTLVYDYPRDISPLAKPVKSNPDYVERFEVFIAGEEYGNSYSEANDPLILRENFEQQAALREKGEGGAHPVDEDFLEAMEYGMPPTSGLGIGMERLFMLLTDNPSIREVMLFPALRPR